MDNDWCTVCDKHVDVPGKLYCSQACRDSDIGDAQSENGWHTDCSTRYGSSVSLASSVDSTHSLMGPTHNWVAFSSSSTTASSSIQNKAVESRFKWNSMSSSLSPLQPVLTTAVKATTATTTTNMSRFKVETISADSFSEMSHSLNKSTAATKNANGGKLRRTTTTSTRASGGMAGQYTKEMQKVGRLESTLLSTASSASNVSSEYRTRPTFFLGSPTSMTTSTANAATNSHRSSALLMA
ncbi:hypothetical protein BDF19DRAFT_88050 [Syncephalis fuscata]|nr:hypothetical protein BDF19DRAFT_88050 [Syncephalis fuscata]